MCDVSTIGSELIFIGQLTEIQHYVMMMFIIILYYYQVNPELFFYSSMNNRYAYILPHTLADGVPLSGSSW